MIKNKVSVNLYGQMEEAIKVIGKMVNKMEEVYTKIKKVYKNKELG